MTSGRIRVPMGAADGVGYAVVIRPGAMHELEGLLRDEAPAERYVIIADATVAQLYGDAVRKALARARIPADLLTFAAGEPQKTRESWMDLTDELLRLGLGRDGCILALGGGVTGDLAGFVAATYMRGIPVVQIPTSLLAMVDSCVGGKTGVDTERGKNLVGAFHPPRLVVIDPAVLATLDDSDFRSGLAEVVKHGAITDAKYLESIASDSERILARDAAVLTPVIGRSVQIKADIVARDPYEHGERQVLNFGHTIGHAVESAADYAVPHGDAVAIGMVAEAEIGERKGITEPGTADRLRRILHSLGLPTRPDADSPPDPQMLTQFIARDKKVRSNTPFFTLLARPGEIARGKKGEWALPVENDTVQEILAEITSAG